MKQFIIILLLLFSINIFAGNGIISVLNNYVYVHQQLIDIQDRVNENEQVAKQYEKLLSLEDNYVKQINDILSHSPEFEQLTVNYLTDQLPDEDLMLFERFIPKKVRVLSPAMKQLKDTINMYKEIRRGLRGHLTGLVNASGLNLRKGPGTSYGIIDVLSRGTRVNVLFYTGNWVKVEHNEKEGFVYEKYLDIEKPTEVINKNGIIISTIGANIRKGPSTRYQKISVIAYGGMLRVNFALGNWYNVTLYNNKIGYVYSSLVELQGSSNNGDSNSGTNNNNGNNSNNSNSSNNSNNNNSNSENPTGSGSDIPVNISSYTRITSQRPTFYVLAEEKNTSPSGIYNGVHYNGSEVRNIKSVNGSIIAKTNGRFYAHLCMQGSGELKDGRRVTWVANYRFKLLKGNCMGITSTGYPVINFHTLAVNKNEMPYKGVYYIPKTKGLKLPSGEVHDGFWFAHDTGGASAFNGTPKHRIDMFVGYMKNIKFMANNGIPNMKPLKIYRVDSATKKKVYEKYSKDLSNKSKELLKSILF